MSFNLSIYITGAIGVVPDAPLFKKERGNWCAPEKGPTKLSFLFPDLRLSRPVSWKYEGKTVVRGSHWPTLRVHEKHYFQSTLPRKKVRDIDLTIQDGCDTCYLFALDRERLILPDLQSPLIVHREIPENQNQKQPDDDNEQSLWWVPRLHEIYPEGTLVPASLDESRNDLMAENLIAHILFSQGEVSVCDYNRRSVKGPKQVWVFTPPRRGYHSLVKPRGVWNRVIGNKIRVDYKALAEPVRLEFARRRHGSETAFADFYAQDGETVNLHLSNGELEDLLPERRLPDNERLNQDPDFSEIHQLIVPNNVAGPVPDRRASSAGETRRPCAQGVFDGWR